MKFVEDTGANWAAIQLKAVEMEIEQQKREWEEKRLAQQQQQELEKQNVEKEDSELLTYSREDSLNKVNIKSNKKSILGKRKSENVNHSSSTSQNSKNSSNSSSNGTVTRNGIMKENDKSVNNKKEKEKIIAKTPPKNVDTSFKRTTRNTSRTNEENVGKINSRIASIIPRQRAMSRKSDISSSSKSKKTIRSTSESTTRSTSMSRQTSVQDDSDSECSLDVMVDSNDVNDSDSNSNHKAESNFDSTSQDDDTIINDDSTITDETTIEKLPKPLLTDKKSTSSPRTRSRGTVNLNLWTLDESPILPIKRQKVSTSNNIKNNMEKTDDLSKEDRQVKKEFGVKECKISMVDIQQQKKQNATPSPQSRANRKLLSSAKNNHTLDSWIQKMPDPPLKAKQQTSSNDEDNTPKIRPRRVVAMQNKTL